MYMQMTKPIHVCSISKAQSHQVLQKDNFTFLHFVFAKLHMYFCCGTKFLDAFFIMHAFMKHVFNLLRAC